MSRRRRIYEGKAKTLFEGPEPGTIVQYFKDDATAFNNQKKGTITGKGVINNRISEFLMMKLGEIGVPTHFIRRLNMREQLIREVEIIPVETVVRNVLAGSLDEQTLALRRIRTHDHPIAAALVPGDTIAAVGLRWSEAARAWQLPQSGRLFHVTEAASG